MGLANLSKQKTAQEVSLSALFEPVASELDLVESWLRSNLIDDSPFVTTLLNQVFQAGGKRLRPALVLLASKATVGANHELSSRHIVLAVLTELIHTASLVHDDIIDSASLRRGQETVNRRFNDRLAVLVGDLLFAQASICLARLMNPTIVGIYGQVLGDLCAGELSQMRQQYALEVDLDSYVKKSIGKTASLFAAGCHSGSILSGCEDRVILALKEYGLSLGICFQIIDDVLDLMGTSAQLGKPAGSDLAQGIINAPAIFVLQRQDGPAKQLAALIKSRQVAQSEGLAEALAIIHSNGGIEKAFLLAEDYAARSKNALCLLKQSLAYDSLEAIPDYILMRTN